MKNNKLFKILFLASTIFVFSFSYNLSEATFSFDGRSLITCKDGGIGGTGLCYENSTPCWDKKELVTDSMHSCMDGYHCCNPPAGGTFYCTDPNIKNGYGAVREAKCVDNAVHCVETNTSDKICGTGKKCCFIRQNVTATDGEDLEEETIDNPIVSTVVDYSDRSLMTCNGRHGLCYTRTASGCPSGTSYIVDVGNECKNTICCRPNIIPNSCGTGGLCVDNSVECKNVISGNCASGQRCCSIKFPDPVMGDDENTTTVKSSTPVPYPSQCNINNQGCTNANDRAILVNQCEALFNPNECVSMYTYLASLTNKCLNMKPAGIDCGTIDSGGFYGNEAAKFADYFISAVAGATDGSSVPGDTTTGAGGLDFDVIAAHGLPDAPGIKVVLVNIVKWMFEILAIITLIAFIISGGQYLLSSGDEKMAETAKRNMTYAIIGIIVALSGFIILRAIDTALRATSSLF